MACAEQSPGGQDPFCAVETGVGGRNLTDLLLGHLPDGEFRKIFIKPNWVRHQQDEAFPIGCLVTSPRLLDSLIEACLGKYRSVERIIVGDVPLQDCDWDQLSAQAGIAELKKKYERASGPLVRIADLRRERFRNHGGYLEPDAPNGGDELGYRDVVLDQRSFLEEISDAAGSFRVADYSRQVTTSSHRKGFHRYHIAASALDCDLFLNVPKMKTHQKTGITGALKNLIGINGEKASLVHYRSGGVACGGDEFPPGAAPLLILQTRLRSLVQKRSKLLFRLGAGGWRVARWLGGIEVRGTPQNLAKCFYTTGGAWFGNDTLWRTIYDLNRIVRYAPPAGGALRDTPQRAYFTVIDGMLAGEGNGPLQALPVATDALVLASDPFLADAAMSALMGFDYRKIPVLSHMTAFQDPAWGRFSPEGTPVWWNGSPRPGLESLPVLHPFRPAPGWRGHIERDE
jgi:Uncharacterized conserved protein